MGGATTSWLAERRPPREAWLLSALQLALIFPAFAFLALQMFDARGVSALLVVTAIAVLGLLAALGLARAGYCTASAVLTVAITAGACFVSVAYAPANGLASAYLCVSVVLAGLLLGARAVLVAMAVVLVTVLVGLPMLGVSLDGGATVAGITLPTTVGGLLYLALSHRAAFEQRRQAQLENSEARWHTVAQLTPVGIFRADVERKSIAGNRVWSDAVGAGEDAVSLLGWIDRVHADDRARVLSQWRTVLAGGAAFDVEFRMVGQVGRVRWVLARAVPEHDMHGNIVAFVGSLTDISEQRRSAERLRQSEERIRHIFQSSPLVMGILRVRDFAVVDVNQAFSTVMELSRTEVIGHTDVELGLWADRDTAQEFRRLVALGCRLHDVEWALRSRTGAIRHIRGSVERIQLDDEAHLLVVGQDVTDRKHDELKMQKLSRALQQTADSVVITDVDGVIEYVNPAFERLTGWSADEAVGKTPRLVKSGMHELSLYRQLWASILSGEVFRHVMTNRKKTGDIYYEEKTISPLRDARNRVTHFISTGKDVTERMQTQERLRFMAHHDALTELPNRVLFMDRLTQATADAKWRARLVAVMFIDLDHFKRINDTLGHEAGDALLITVAARLSETLRERDTVARFGGDEFAIMLGDVAAQSDVEILAEKVLEVLRQPVTVQEQKFFLSASMGISMFPGDALDASTLLRNADTAMYRAKETGKNNYQFYSAEMSKRAMDRMILERSLRQALEREEFRVYYQPQVDLESGRIIGVEALLRWERPGVGIVPPADFLPLLEDTGLIRPVGDWVLRKVCEQARRWCDFGLPSVRVAVNLSGQQLRQPGFFAAVSSLMDEFNLPPECLELEITENSLLHDVEHALQDLDVLSRDRIRLAIDDFGTGYSSLIHLKRLPVDTLKIDRSFVRDAPNDPHDAAITRSIIAMGRSLQLDVVAEGVETALQLDFLRAEQCGTYQGYFASEPIDAGCMTSMLQRAAV